MATHVRQGWYGNERDIPPGDSCQKFPVACNKLFLMSLKYATAKFVSLCEGFEEEDLRISNIFLVLLVGMQ
jgi:hypothetical protein